MEKSIEISAQPQSTESLWTVARQESPVVCQMATSESRGGFYFPCSVVGSIILRISVIFVAGNPLIAA
jgi:hypothetical protein